MNPSSQYPHRRRLTRAEARRRRRNRAIRRVAGLTLVACVLVGGVSFLLHRKAPVPAASAASALPAASSTVASKAATNGLFGKNEAASSAVSSEPAAPDNALGLTAEEASAMLADSSTSVNKTLQTVACDAFLAMQKAAAADGVTVWMQSGYRSVSYQTKLYERKTQYYRDKGYDEATAKEKAAAIVNPPGYSEHNCGLAADLNSPEHTGLDEGFENTAAFRWLCEHAAEYGFILRYPQGAEDATEITYEPWHWRYVGPENAAKINASGLCFEDYIAALQSIAA